MAVNVLIYNQLIYINVDIHYTGVKGGRCVGLASLPPSCADCLGIWEPELP